MVGKWEVHKRAITILAYIAAVVGGFFLFLSVLSLLVGPVVAGIITVCLPAALGFYYLLYIQEETDMMMNEKWKELHEDVMKNGRYRDD